MITDLLLLALVVVVIAYIVHGFVGRPRRQKREQRGFEVIMKQDQEKE